MTEQMTPLRRRMIDDMAIRNMSPNTQKIYIRAVANFSAYHGQSPDKLTFEDVREYQLHLTSCGLKVRSTNVIMCALRFFIRNDARQVECVRTHPTRPHGGYSPVSACARGGRALAEGCLRSEDADNLPHHLRRRL